MAQQSKIQWTGATWNIARGCTKVDDDCKYCYMYRESLDGTRYQPKEVVRTKTVFDLPLRLKEPSKIFTSSLTDVFHPEIDQYRDEMWDIIRRCPQHTFQILTKRPERISLNLPPDWNKGWKNVWLGTSVGSQESVSRIMELLVAKASVRFLSLEPLYGPVDLTRIKSYTPEGGYTNDVLSGKESLWNPNGPVYNKYSGESSADVIDWVIVGGESGNENGKYRYRPCELEWIEDIVQQCQIARVPVFVKQLGTHLAKKLGLKDRHGGNIDEWPEHLRIRQFPNVKTTNQP